MAQAELLRRFELLNQDHLALVEIHGGCANSVAALFEAQQVSQKNQTLLGDLQQRFDELNLVHTACAGKEKVLNEQVDKIADHASDMARERNDWRQKASEQVEKIKQLESELASKSRVVSDLETRNKHLEAENVQST